MLDQENITKITNYIDESRTLGNRDYQIFAALAEVGWQINDIVAAFETAKTEPQPAVFGAVQVQVGPIIRVENLTKKYGDFIAVDDISFEVNRGDTFGILGPNGAGKTTTLEVIEGLKKANSGTVLVDNLDVAHQTHEVKSIIGVQLQASTFFENLKLTELLDIFAALYGKTVNAMEILEEVQLAEKWASQIKELSGGQKQRFSIAAGLVNNPKVLFLDEPTTGLDPQARRNLWELIKQIKSRGTTVVLTTHYMEEAEVLCNRIAIMDHAKIIALDTTENLLSKYGATMEEVFLNLTGHQLRE